ncbi:MAG: DNA primase [Bacilli bacterium]
MDKDNVLDNIDIVDVVSEYITLERKGKNYFGVCPFHDDTNPSMSVSPQKQLYKCFSCGAGGDAINFVKNIENISFNQALVKLGKTVGIEVKSFNEVKDLYYSIYLDSNRFFTFTLLHSKMGREYLNYLLNRKFNIEDIEIFSIGCSNNEIVELLNSKYKHEEIIKTGLINSNNKLIFKSRILFPIADIHGNIIGYSGRVINESAPKYLNTPETKYFKKSDILYNINLANSEIVKRNALIITEGFFDVMRLYSNGYKHVVATMGTAFTVSHRKLINSLTDNIYLCMDSDSAGIMASKNIYNSLKNSSNKIRFIELEGLDVDEYILQYGINSFTIKYKSAKIFEEYFVDKIIYGYSEMNISNKAKILDDVKGFITTIPNNTVKQLLVNYVEDKIGVSVGGKSSKMQATSIKSRSEHTLLDCSENLIYDENLIDKTEQEFLYLMLNNREAIDIYSNILICLSKKENDEIAMLIQEFYKQNEFEDIIEWIKISNNYNETKQEIIIQKVKKILTIELESDIATINDYVVCLKSQTNNKTMVSLPQKIAMETDKDKRMKLLEKLGKLSKKNLDQN